MLPPRPILEVHSACVSFPIKQGFWQKNTHRHALNNVSLSLTQGTTLGLIGESGCGKSTLARVISGLIKPTTGSILFDGADILKKRGTAYKTFRRELQMIFQDPGESLNPRHTVETLLREPFAVHNIGTHQERNLWMKALLEQVGLSHSSLQKFPFEFSGGQRQRIGIARAIALKPRLIICDEPTSALDVSIQGQILNLLLDLQANHGISYLFISHDLAVIRQMANHIAVMKEGSLIEEGPTNTVFETPTHPYTQSLISTALQLS